GDTVPADVRIVTATNKDLAAEVAAGRFREDLFYRLNVSAITAPPPRTRREDVPLLVDHFLGIYCAKNGRPRLTAPREVLQLLSDYRWPGTVREAANVMERAVVLCRGDGLTVDDLPETIRNAAGSAPSALRLSVGAPHDAMRRRLLMQPT